MSKAYYRGSTRRTVEEAIKEVASKPGATRQDVEREVWRHASGEGNQSKFAERFQEGINAVKEHYIKPADGVTVRNIDES